MRINVSEAGDPLAESKGIWIDIDWSEVSVSVTGSDATWVRGRSEEIKAALRQSRTMLHPSWMFAIYTSGLVFLASLFGPLFVISGVGTGEIAVSFGGSIVLTVAVLALLLRLSKTWISLSDSAKSPLSGADKISVAVLIAAVVTVGIIAYQTWGT